MTPEIENLIALMRSPDPLNREIAQVMITGQPDLRERLIGALPNYREPNEHWIYEFDVDRGETYDRMQCRYCKYIGMGGFNGTNGSIDWHECCTVSPDEIRIVDRVDFCNRFEDSGVPF